MPKFTVWSVVLATPVAASIWSDIRASLGVGIGKLRAHESRRPVKGVHTFTVLIGNNITKKTSNDVTKNENGEIFSEKKTDSFQLICYLFLVNLS